MGGCMRLGRGASGLPTRWKASAATGSVCAALCNRERYQLTGLTPTVRRPTVSGMRSVVADRNSPGNLNDLSCSTKPSRLSAALPSIFGSLRSFFRLMPHHTTIQECSSFCTSLLLAKDQFDRRSRRRTRIPRRLLDLRLVAELAKRPVSSVQPPESIPCRRRCRPAGPG
jgi:hypothetical protein